MSRMEITPLRTALFLTGICIATATSAFAEIPTYIGGNTVRCIYIIPSDREPQPDGVKNFQEYMKLGQEWYADQMRRHGFGNSTFRMEMENDGVTPKIYVVNVNKTAAELRNGSLFSNSFYAAYLAGCRWYSDECWVACPETHVMYPDGSFEGAVALGGPNKAMFGSDMLVFSPMTDMKDNTPYDGLILPDFGPYPMVYDVTYPGWLGSDLSGLTSSWIGGIMHELGHGFGINHTFVNEGTYGGNVMGHGRLAFRGNVFPDLYPNDYCRVAYTATWQLFYHPFFTGSPADLSSSSIPTLNFISSGTIIPENGLINIEFTASDIDGLSFAMLYNNYGDLIGEAFFSGAKNVTTGITTPYWNPDEDNKYFISIWDVKGNRLHPSNAQITLYVPDGYDGAPRPNFTMRPPTAIPGQLVTFDPLNTVDPDGNTVTLDWDFDGDGVYDQTTKKRTVSITYSQPGTYFVKLRASDRNGNVAVSTPVAFEVVGNPPLCGDVNCDGTIDVFDIDPFVEVLVSPGTYATNYPNCDTMTADANGDDVIDVFDIDGFVSALVNGSCSGSEDTTPPTPSQLSWISAEATGYHVLDVEVTPATDDSGSVMYQFEEETGKLPTFTMDTPGHLIANCDDETTYRLRVRAIDAFGNANQWSEYVELTTPREPNIR